MNAAAFAAHIKARLGFAPPLGKIAPGKFVRFPTSDRHGDDSGWCKLFDDGDGGVFGCHRSGISEDWQARSPRTPQERDEFQRKVQQSQEEAAKKEKARRKEAAEKAERLLMAARPATDDHPYLKRKQVPPVDSLREATAEEVANILGYPPKSRDELLTGRILIAPVAVDGALSTCELIDESGRKSAIAGGAKGGGLWAAQDLPKGTGEGLTLYIGEGIATVLSVHEATGAPVVAALSCGNLAAVAKVIREKYPEGRIIVLADKGRGETDAVAAAKAVGGVSVTPLFRTPENGGTDFNDLMTEEGPEVIRKQLGVVQATGPLAFNIFDFGADRYQGEPPRVQWLVKGIFPLGVPLILAGAGAVGKSFALLDLAMKVATGNNSLFIYSFGGTVDSFGSAVFLTAEDASSTIHRRLDAIDPERKRDSFPGKLLIIPLPDAGGPFPLVSQKHGVMEETEQAKELRRQLRQIKDLRLVIIDPLQTFVLADVNKDPAAAQFTCSLLARIAAETGASVIVAHHMKKDSSSSKDVDKDITPEQARDYVRGTSALVDGVRGVYALWPAAPKKAKEHCKTLDIPYRSNRIIYGSIVKSNESESREMVTFYRSDSGLLVDATARLKGKTEKPAADYDPLVEVIAASAISGHPFSKTGAAGLYERRSELPEPFNVGTKHELPKIVERLLEEKRLVQAKAKGGSHTRWLDVPDGPFAAGIGEFKAGAPVPSVPGSHVPTGNGWCWEDQTA